jgi:hypothetical protein
LIAFAATVLATAAVVGYVLGELLRWLETYATEHVDAFKGRAAFAAFHALGGQDARDAFDFALERRRKRDKSFIVVLRVASVGDGDDGLRVGLFGSESYSGTSPRPHDIHLQEVWKFDGPGRLKRVKPPHEAWYKADEIKDIWFREIKPKEIKEGLVRDFARGGLSEALRQHRARYAREVAGSAATLAGGREAAVASINELLDRFESVGSDPTYEEFVDLRDDAAIAAGATAAAAGQNKHLGPAVLEQNLLFRIELARHQKYDWGLWKVMLRYYAELPRERFEWEALDVAAHLAIGLIWFDDVDPADWVQDEGDVDPVPNA